MRSALRLLLLTVLLLSCAAAARADIIIELGNHPQPDEHLVTLSPGRGTTVTGIAGGATVFFSSDEELFVRFSPEPQLLATDGSLDHLLITVPGFILTDVILDLHGIFPDTPGVLSSVNGSGGTSQLSFNGTLGDDDNLNFVAIFATGGTTLTDITIDGRFFDLEDISISGVPTAAATLSDPRSLFLLIAGLPGAWWIVRRHPLRTTS